jgi:MipA family protein
VQRYLPNMLQKKANSGSFAAVNRLLLASAVILLPVVVEAAENENSADLSSQSFDTGRYGDFRDTLHDWNVTVGIGAAYMPEYEGSDKFDINPLPIFSAEFGDRISVDTSGVTVNFFQMNGFKASVKGGYEPGRKEDDSDHLRGLGNIDAGGVVAGILSYQIGPFEAYTELDKTLGGSNGFTGTVGAKALYNYESFIFSADISGTWADHKHMEAYFGVSNAQSANSGLDQYKAKGGVKRVDVKSSITYMVTENWLVTGAAGAGFLIGDAKDSPIVKNDVQPFAILGVSYKF